MHQKTELLQSIKDRGYPTDYLLSRLRGRRIYLIRDWERLLFSSDPLEYLSSTRYGEFTAKESTEGVWQYLLKEFQWVYFQMNRGLQDIFWPFLFYSEIRTLLICLRYKKRKALEGNVERLLSFSLLSEGLKTLLKERELISVIEGMEEVFISLSDRFRGLKDVFIKDGLKGLEQRLTATYLEHIVNSDVHPVIRGFFIYLIDSRNIITLHKHLRWSLSTPPSFVHGGSIREARLKEVIDKQDISGIGQLIYKLTSFMVEKPTATYVENSLLRGLTRFLRRRGRESLNVGLILDYLWRCYIEARNLSLILYGKGLDRDILTGELIH